MQLPKIGELFSSHNYSRYASECFDYYNIIIIFITFKTLHVTAVNAYRQVSRDHVFCLQVLWTYIFVTKQDIAAQPALYVIGHRTLYRVVSSNIYLYNYSIFILNCIITCMFSSFF